MKKNIKSSPTLSFFLSAIIGVQRLTCSNLLNLIKRGRYFDGHLITDNIFLFLVGASIGGILGIGIWLLMSYLKIGGRAKIYLNYYLLFLVTILTIFRVSLGMKVRPPIVKDALVNNVFNLKLYDKFNANLNIRDLNSQTPLIKSSEYHNIESVRFLIESNVDLNVQDKNGETALISAIRESSRIDRKACQIVDALIEAGANLDEKDMSGETALMKAAKSGNTCSVNKLLEAGADINIQDRHGSTAMMHAAGRGHDKIVQIFRDFTIRVFMKFDRG